MLTPTTIVVLSGQNVLCSMCKPQHARPAGWRIDGVDLCAVCYRRRYGQSDDKPLRKQANKAYAKWCTKQAKKNKLARKAENRAKRKAGYVYDNRRHEFYLPTNAPVIAAPRSAKYKEDDPAMELWRHIVYKQDKYTCQMCGKTNMLCHAHHVYSRFKYPALRHLPENGVCLCEPCHFDRVHKNGETCEAIDAKLASLKQYIKP